MVRTTRRAAAAAVLALVATTFSILTGVAGPAAAAPACAPGGPAPEVLAVAATDVGFTSVQSSLQKVAVTVRNGCSDVPPGNCSADPGACTRLLFTFRRSGSVGPLASACNHSRSTESDGSPRATGDPSVYVYDVGLSWSLEYNDDEQTPAMTNACAGPWDAVVTPSNDFRVDDTYSSTKGASYAGTRAFSLFRGSKLGTNASPEPVRRGAYVTVKGRLTRQQLAPDRLSTGANGNTYVAFSSQPVQLQRRTLDGTYNYIRTVRSTKGGYVTTRIKALAEDRCYRWVFRGTDTTQAVIAGGDCVHVRR